MQFCEDRASHRRSVRARQYCRRHCRSPDSDSNTGLGPYLVHRYYDPATGQFLSVDPAVSLTQAPYSYAADDPVNGSDPSGLIPSSPACAGSGPIGYSPGQLAQLCAAQQATSRHVLKEECKNDPGPCKNGTTLSFCLDGTIGFIVGWTSSACIVVAGNDQLGFTDTAGSVRGFAFSGGVSIQSSNVCSVQQLGGDFHSGGANEPFLGLGGSYAHAGSTQVRGFGAGVGAGVWGGTTDTKTAGGGSRCC